jgi:hypothetical protein
MSRSGQHTPLSRRHNKAMLFFLASLSCAGIALIAALVYVALHDGFGAGDIWAFAFWLAHFSVVVGIVALALGAIRCHVLLRLALSVIIGFVVGYVWTWFVYFALGPWFGASSIPVLHLWMLGAAVGLLCGGAYVGLYGRGTK